MLRLRFLVPVLGFSSLVAVACTDSGDGSPGGGAGAAGQSGSDAGAAGTVGQPGGDAGAAGTHAEASGGACSTDGSGKIVVQVVGLPDGVDADISFSGADDLAVTMSDTLEGLPVGTYTVKAARVFDQDAIVRTVFDATVAEPEFCLRDGGSQTVKVTYTAIPSSNKLWMLADADAELAAFSSAALAETGMTDATVGIHGPVTASIAFDQNGNLWAGAAAAEQRVVRFKASTLGATGTRTPDVMLNVPALDCVPPVANIAFDADGNLWLSSACKGELHRLAAADLATSGDKTADVVVSGLTDNDGIAFDKDGNLWVGGGAKLLRYDAARLGTSDADPADLALSVTAAVGNTELKIDTMAFDQAGNLWGIDKGANAVIEIATDALAQTGDLPVKAEHSFVVTVTGLPTSPAFDEGNGLWVSLDSGNFGRFSPTQLSKSAGTGAPVKPATLISSGSVGAGLPFAFFPAPAGLPLYHAIPTP